MAPRRTENRGGENSTIIGKKHCTKEQSHIAISERNVKIEYSGETELALLSSNHSRDDSRVDIPTGRGEYLPDRSKPVGYLKCLLKSRGMGQIPISGMTEV